MNNCQNDRKNYTNTQENKLRLVEIHQFMSPMARTLLMTIEDLLNTIESVQISKGKEGIDYSLVRQNILTLLEGFNSAIKLSQEVELSDILEQDEVEYLYNKDSHHL